MEDDNAYVALIDKYKQSRGGTTEQQIASLRYLDAAIALKEKGRVSQDAVLGGAYL
jgi:hypothetical protein